MPIAAASVGQVKISAYKRYAKSSSDTYPTPTSAVAAIVEPAAAAAAEPCFPCSYQKTAVVAPFRPMSFAVVAEEV